MKKQFMAVCVVALALTICSASYALFSPGQQTLVLAHNTYPEKGQYTDRFDRALTGGMPLVMEIDLTWGPNPKTGTSASLVGDYPERRFKEITGDEPVLKQFFFERVRPIVEKALKENNKKDWPLIRLYLDIKNDPPEHLEYLWSLLGEYESWITTAVKTTDASKQSPLVLKPLLVMTEEKDNDIKEEYFYNRIPVGGKLRVFGTAKLSMPEGQNLTEKQIAEMRYTMKPEELIKERASNYGRWWGCPWNMVEAGSKDAVGQWNPEKEARLTAIVKHAHGMGYLVSFWNLNGADVETCKKQGWNPKYTFGSMDSAKIRWKAIQNAGGDFVGTDQYEEVAKTLKGHS